MSQAFRLRHSRTRGGASEARLIFSGQTSWPAQPTQKPPRKKPRRERSAVRRRAKDLIDPFDQAVDCGHHLAAYVELMQKCNPAELVEGATVAHWGTMLREEIREQQAHVQALKP